MTEQEYESTILKLREECLERIIMGSKACNEYWCRAELKGEFFCDVMEDVIELCRSNEKDLPKRFYIFLNMQRDEFEKRKMYREHMEKIMECALERFNEKHPWVHAEEVKE